MMDLFKAFHLFQYYFSLFGAAMILPIPYIMGVFQFGTAWALLSSVYIIQLMNIHRRDQMYTGENCPLSGLSQMMNYRVIRGFASLYFHLFLGMGLANYVGCAWSSPFWLFPLTAFVSAFEAAYLDHIGYEHREMHEHTGELTSGESCDWLSRIFVHAIPYVDKHLNQLVVSNLEAMLVSYLPNDIGIECVRIKNVEIGKVPPVVTNIRINSKKKDVLLVFADVQFNSQSVINCEVKLGGSADWIQRFAGKIVPVSMKHMQLVTKLRMEIFWLETSPFIGNIHMLLTQAPYIDLKVLLFNQIDITWLPGLLSFVNKTISPSLNSKLLPPNEYIYTIGTNKFENLAFTEMYQVTVTVMGATDLIASDVGNTSDPYCWVHFNGNHFKTPVIKKTLNPVWTSENVFSFTVMSKCFDSIKFEVVDWDRIGKDEKIGKYCVPIHTLITKALNNETGIITELPLLINKKKIQAGKLKIRFCAVVVAGVDHQQQQQHSQQQQPLSSSSSSTTSAPAQPGLIKSSSSSSLDNISNCSDTQCTSPPNLHQHREKLLPQLSFGSTSAVASKIRKNSVTSPSHGRRPSISVAGSNQGRTVGDWIDGNDMLPDSPDINNTNSNNNNSSSKEAAAASSSSSPSLLAMTKCMNLIVHLTEGEDLIAADRGGTSDPYVIFTVSGQQKMKSKVVKKTLNPVWNQSFQFKISNPQQDVLTLNVWDEDRFFKDDPLGHASIPIRNLSLDPSTAWIKLEGVEKGSIHLALALTPDTDVNSGNNNNNNNSLEKKKKK